MSTRFHGVTSIGIVGLAIVIAAVVLFRESVVLGLIYLALLAGGGGIIVWAYCAKCPCKAHCAHVLPGKAAMWFNRTPGPYVRWELAAMVLALAGIVVLPQPWLWGSTGLFIAYWVLVGIGLVQVRGVVCKACNNAFCPLNKGYKSGAARRV